MIELTTLGRTTIHQNGAELSQFAAHKQKFALLVYIAYEGPVSRDRILSLFWPEREEEKARHSLSQALYALRRELCEECFLIEGDMVSVDPALVTLDANLVAEAARREAWDEVAERYTGAFLEQFYLPRAPDFDEWVANSRNRLSRLASLAFTSLVEERHSRGDVEGASMFATRWAAMAPLEDEAQHALIALLAQAGKRTEALQSYEAYRRRLERELEVDPLDTTVELVDRIRAGESTQFRPLALGESSPEVDADESGVIEQASTREPAAPVRGSRRGDRPWSDLIGELRTRHVWKVAVAYLAFAGLSLETTDTLIDNGILWQWLFTPLVVVLGLGLPLALLIAWGQDAPLNLAYVRRFRPRWAEKVRAGHLLAVLSALVIGLLVGRALLRPDASRLPDEPHLAVIPFVAIGDDPASQAFSDGLVETVTTMLTQVQRFKQRLWVVPAAVVRREEITGVSEARMRFGINLAITGSVQTLGDSVRVTLNLVDPGSLRQLRSKLIQESKLKLNGLQDAIAEDLMEMLELRLEPEEHQVLASGATVEPGAYEFYVQGEGYLQRYEEDDLDNAINLFQAALERDPKFALAHAALAEAYRRKFDVARESQWVEKAREHSLEALELNDQLARVRVTRGLLYSGEGRDEDAVPEFLEALRIDPASSEAYAGLAGAYRALGQIEEAESTYLRAIELKPSYWGGYNALGVFYYGLGRYEEAAEQFLRVTRLTPDNFRGYSNLGAMYQMLERHDAAAAMYLKSVEVKPTADGYSNLATYYFQLGRLTEAARTYEKAIEVDDRGYEHWHNLASAYYWAPGERDKAPAAYERAAQLAQAMLDVNPNDTDALTRLADSYSMLGKRDAALEHLERALEIAPLDPEVLFRAGDIYEELGERESALEWIAKAIERGYPVEELERLPGLAELRADPRFDELRLASGEQSH